MRADYRKDLALKEARALVLRQGRQATSFQIVNPGMALDMGHDPDYVAGHVDVARYRVVAGAPVCALEDTTRVLEEINGRAAAQGRRVCLFAAESWLLAHLPRSMQRSAVLLGAQPVWSVPGWSDKFKSHASLRAQLNRARNKSVRVEEWPAGRAQGNEALHKCLEDWLGTRGLPPMHFLVEPETLERLFDRRVFVATRENRVVGFLVMTPIPCRRGWLVEQLVRGRDAVNGTAELLLDTAVRAVGEDGYEQVTLGLAALSREAGLDYGLNPWWLRLIFGWARAHGRRFYNFEGLDAFKAKFRPDAWEPIYAITNQPRFGVAALYAIAAAFSDHSPASMLVRAMGRALRTELRWLGRRLSGR